MLGFDPEISPDDQSVFDLPVAEPDQTRTPVERLAVPRVFARFCGIERQSRRWKRTVWTNDIPRLVTLPQPDNGDAAFSLKCCLPCRRWIGGRSHCIR